MCFRVSLKGPSGMQVIAGSRDGAYRITMRMTLLAIALSGWAVGAQTPKEQTVTVPPEAAKTYTPQTKDPQQSRIEQTTQIATNSAKGTAPINYKGAATVDEDL